MAAKVTIDQVMDAVEQDDNLGFCLACGEEAMGVEPDARRYECESCGQPLKIIRLNLTEVFGRSHY